MLNYEFKKSRDILVNLLKQNGYFEEWFESSEDNYFPIPHPLSVFIKKGERHRLQSIVKKIVTQNRFEISNYLYLKSQTLGHLYDNDFLLAKNIKDFALADIDYLCTYICDVEESIYFNIKKYKPENQEIIKMRIDGHTLESVGRKMNLTRERIRQIVANYLRSMDGLLKDFFSFYFNDCAVHSADLEVLGLSDETKKHVLNYLKNSKLFYHVKMFDIYIFEDLDEYNRILRLAINLTSSMSISDQDIDEYLSELRVNIARESVTNYLILSNYYYFNGKYIKYTRYADYLLEIISAKFPGGIELKQLSRTDDFDKLIEYSNKYFPNVKFVAEPRPVQSRLAKDLVSIDRSIYIPKYMIEEMNFNISAVLDYLESSDLRVYYFSELYSRFSKLLLSEGIENWYFLRELIKLNYYGDVSYSRDYIEIKARTGSGFLNERVANYVSESKVPVTSNEINTNFRDFSTIMLYSATNRNDRIIRWGRDSWLSVEKYNNLTNTNNILEETAKIIEQDYYASFDKLFFQLSINNDLRDCYIFSPDNLSAYLTNIYPTSFKYFDEGLSKLDSNISDKVEERYVSLLGTYPEWNYHEMKHFMTSQRLKPTTTNYINRMLNFNSIRIDRDNNILVSKFSLDRKVVSQLEDDIEYIIGNIEENLTPHYLIDNGYLPHDVGVNWNWFLLTSVLNTFGEKYKVILPVPSDRRYQEGLIVEKNSGLLISDNLLKYFEKLGISRVSEVELKKYIMERKISENIPYEFYQNESIDYAAGYFYLKGKDLTDM